MLALRTFRAELYQLAVGGANLGLVLTEVGVGRGDRYNQCQYPEEKSLHEMHYTGSSAENPQSRNREYDLNSSPIPHSPFRIRNSPFQISPVFSFLLSTL